jgi:hypothetical protein
MITWTIEGTNQCVGNELPSLVQSGWLHPARAVSADGGRTWIPALEAARRLAARGDDGLAFIVPMRTATYATLAQYIGLFSLLFFGGPLSFMTAALAFDHGPTKRFRIIFALVAAVLGPAPVALFACLGRREIKKDPTLRGTGRVIFAWVCVAPMAIACAAGIVGALTH